MRAAVFLDRDGVLNRAIVRDGRPYPPATMAEFEILPGVPEACARLRAAGFLLVIVTNQPDVATGKQDRAIVEEFHRCLRNRLEIDDIRACFAVDGPNVDCYKPKPGMLLAAAAEHNIDLSQSWIVGDRWRDVGAGRAAGCKTVFIDHNYYADRRPEPPDHVAASLSDAADHILARLAHDATRNG